MSFLFLLRDFENQRHFIADVSTNMFVSLRVCVWDAAYVAVIERDNGLWISGSRSGGEAGEVGRIGMAIHGLPIIAAIEPPAHDLLSPTLRPVGDDLLVIELKFDAPTGLAGGAFGGIFHRCPNCRVSGRFGQAVSKISPGRRVASWSPSTRSGARTFCPRSAVRRGVT